MPPLASVPPTSETTPGPVLLDRLAPVSHGTVRAHRVVDVAADRVWEAMLDTDFRRAIEALPPLRVAYWLRGLPARLQGHPIAAPGETMRLSDLPTSGPFVRLAVRAGTEIAFGMVGRFWGADVTWLATDADAFPDFDRPGFARIVNDVTVVSWGTGRSLVTYEIRTIATDEAAHRGFRRYWVVVRPVVAMTARSFLRQVERSACAGSGT